MKVSIITVCYNSEQVLQDAINSVSDQDYDNIEYIVIDGGSSDNTVSIIERNSDKIKVWISEPDEGIYDAMNKGITLATGDVVGILNSDDVYTHNAIISQVVQAFTSDTDSVIGDIFFVSPGNLERVVRTYSSSHWSPVKFVWGFMPPHPSFFVRKKYYDKLGVYKIDYKIASDYELLIRFLAVNKLNYKYLPIEMVKMRTGGASTKNWKSNTVLNKEIIRACRENGLKTNYLMVYSKYFKKVFELINR
ncbi:glycosyltransferase [Fulvivirga sp. M361]|uniref:glycosyltransferase family 2 protein n=1 Tax=Fulvivirga sp. M361 TaxID=2594266 RepID=UPI00117AD559|nr:glycosyltransferase family 2 protein [Fulvivirga sp. M361]TRX50236.1 glycosyltransferase [Fulvivirga sp. M361]